MPELEDCSIQFAMTSMPELWYLMQPQFDAPNKFEKMENYEKTVSLFYTSFYEALNDGALYPWSVFDALWQELYRVLKQDGVFILNIGTPSISPPESMGGGLLRLFGPSLPVLYPYLMVEHILHTTGFELENDLVWVEPNLQPLPGVKKLRVMGNYEHFFLLAKASDYKFIPERSGWCITGGFVMPVTIMPEPGQPRPFEPAVVRHLVESFTEEGDIVLDPLAGTGTLGAEAVRMKRNAVLYELVKSLEPVIRVKVGAEYFA